MPFPHLSSSLTQSLIFTKFWRTLLWKSAWNSLTGSVTRWHKTHIIIAKNSFIYGTKLRRVVRIQNTYGIQLYTVLWKPSPHFSLPPSSPFPPFWVWGAVSVVVVVLNRGRNYGFFPASVSKFFLEQCYAYRFIQTLLSFYIHLRLILTTI